MIKFSKLADYAVVVLAILVKSDGELMSASALSQQSGLPEPTVSKVLKLLSKSDVLTSIRGVAGGYRLSKSPDKISVAQIVTAVDGPVALTSCVDHGNDSCCYAGTCPTKGSWNRVNAAIEETLENITLSDMVRPDYDFINIKPQKEGINA